MSATSYERLAELAEAELAACEAERRGELERLHRTREAARAYATAADARTR
ncbi:MAG TPA: hypothetical protein VN522_01990 [Solirubrobacterales bacterium]|nr:hypothetical protein [Solirubrobacterales bacterium]